MTSSAQAAAPHDLVARLERLPLTGYQRRLFAIVATAWLADQVDVALLTFLLGALTAAFHLSPHEAGRLAAMTFAGQLVGNILAGLASDRWGRRAVFQVTMVVWGLASFAAAASWSLASLMVFRFLIGAGVGGEAPVAQAMVAEIVPAAHRGRYIAYMEGLWAVGYVVSGALSFAILPYLGWRWAFAAVGVLAVVVLLVRRDLPESPRWLSSRGRRREAEAVVARMEAEVETRLGRALPPVAPGLDAPGLDATGLDAPGLDAPGLDAPGLDAPGLDAPSLDAGPAAGAGALATIFSRAYGRRTIMAFGLWFFALIGFFGLNSWIAVLLQARGLSAVGSVGFVTLITIGGIPGFVAAAWLLERIGRKPTTVAFLLLAAAAAWLYGNAGSREALFATGFTMQFFMFGMWCCLYAYTPELYPTRARATGAGFASAFGRVGAILGPILVPDLVARGGAAAAFEVGGGGFVVAALLVTVLGVETRGRVLEAVSQ